MDMIAYYDKPLAQIWQETTELAGWTSYGGLEDTGSNTGRADIDAVLEAKEELINELLDRFAGKKPGEATFDGLPVVYAGGIRYDFVELVLRDAQGDARHYLRARASGTEPINRVYVESSSLDVAKRLRQAALCLLEEFSAAEIRRAHSEWRLIDILSSTQWSPALLQATEGALAAHGDWQRQNVVAGLKRMLPTVERRNQRTISEWISALSGNDDIV
jgi:hypothetical protein